MGARLATVEVRMGSRRRVRVLQHVAAEGPGLIADALARQRVEQRTSRIDLGDTVPVGLEEDGLVVMGGPMGVYDAPRLPHLRTELRLIEAALRDDRPILGICLGSQLLATALGAPVRVGPSKEIGWELVTLTDAGRSDRVLGAAPPRFRALHWHGDVFDLPAGAVALARSMLTENQAFRHGRNAYGLLFHLEAGFDHVRAMAEEWGDELRQAGVVPQRLVENTSLEAPRAAEVARAVFDKWVSLLTV